MLSQVILQGTLERKGFPAICSKLLQQIASKVGNVLWVAEPPHDLPPKMMLIGVDVSHDKSDKAKSVVAFCASIDQTFTRYYSRVIF